MPNNATLYKETGTQTIIKPPQTLFKCKSKKYENKCLFFMYEEIKSAYIYKMAWK